MAQDTRTTRSVDGLSIRFDVWGGELPDPALVLVHGWSNNRSYWDPHVPALSKTRPVVTIDLPGFGESGSTRVDWSMEAFGDDVAAVVRALELDRVVLVGFSMGAAVVLEAALDEPERVAGVVLVDWLQDPATRYSDEFISEYVELIRGRWTDRAWIREAGFTSESPDSLITRYIDSHPPAPPPHWITIFEQTLRWADQQLIEALERITVPVAAINSDLVPTDVDAYRELVPTFQLRTMPGLGHIGVIWERVDLFDRHLEELAVAFSGVGDELGFS